MPFLRIIVLEWLVMVPIDWPCPPDVRLAEMQGRSELPADKCVPAVKKLAPAIVNGKKAMVVNPFSV